MQQETRQLQDWEKRIIMCDVTLLVYDNSWNGKGWGYFHSATPPPTAISKIDKLRTGHIRFKLHGTCYSRVRIQTPLLNQGLHSDSTNPNLNTTSRISDLKSNTVHIPQIQILLFESSNFEHCPNPTNPNTDSRSRF